MVCTATVFWRSNSKNIVLLQHHIVTWPLFWKRNMAQTPSAHCEGLVIPKGEPDAILGTEGSHRP